MRIFTSLAILAFMASIEAGRVKRATINNCQTNPSDQDAENVVDDGATMSINCNLDSKVLSCIWRHTDPISEKTQGSSANPTILCSGGTDSNGRQCSTDTRVTYRNSESSCAIDVSNTKPEDTGKWYLTAVTLNKNGQGTQEYEKPFDIYTFNQSLVELVDEDLQTENSIDTTYNYDTKEEEWIDGKGGWESIEFSCMAYGGRPRPEFRWYIGNNDNRDLSNEDHFSITNSQIGSDYQPYIENHMSTIEFSIDNNLLDILRDEGVDVNPSNGRFTFDISCEVVQGNQLTQNGNRMRVNVDREYDDGNLKGSMIGVIVGVVLAVVLLIIAVALLVFAKATSRWCFADDYENPANAKSHPRSQMGGARPANQQAQVYRDNIDEKKTATRKSSTSSSNNPVPIKASVPTQKNGEWLPDSRKSAHGYSATPTLNSNLNTPPKTGTTPKTVPIASPSSSSSSSSSNDNNPGAPPRPPKDGLQYANLDHRAFMQDPRNRVLPGGSLPASQTYATVTTREVTQTSSRTFGSPRQ